MADLNNLRSLGFDRETAERALAASQGDMQHAVYLLLNPSSEPNKASPSPDIVPTPSSDTSGKDAAAEGKRIQSWDDNKVAKFIEGVGSGKVWTQYAAKCLEAGVDGQTLFAANVDDLSGIGFSKMHAKAVIVARDAVCAPLVIHSSSSSVITESELTEISKLKTHLDNLAASALRFDKGLEELSETLLIQQSAVNELVDREIAKWEVARTAALTRLRTEEVEFRDQLHRGKAVLAKDIELSQTVMSQINTLCSSPVRLDETHLLQYRQTQVCELVHQHAMAPFLTLAQQPTWIIVRDAVQLVDVKTSQCVIELIDVPARKVDALSPVRAEEKSLDAPPPYVDDDVPRSTPTLADSLHALKSKVSKEMPRVSVTQEPRITDLAAEVRDLLKKYDGGKGYVMTRDCSIHIIPECLKLLKEAKLKYWRLHNPNIAPSIVQQYELTCRNMRALTDHLCSSALDSKISFLVHLATFERNLMTLDQHWGKINS